MNTTTTKPSRPTHRIYAVTKRPGAEKANWTEIGAAWTNSDGKGFNLKLDLVPVNGAELVIRQIEPKEPKEGGGA